MRTLGQWMGKLRRMASEFQGQFQEAMREAEMADLKKQVDEMTTQAQSYANFDPVGEVRKEIESTQQQIESAMAGQAPADAASPPAATETGVSSTAAPVGAETTIAPNPELRLAERQARKRPARPHRSQRRRSRPWSQPRPMPSGTMQEASRHDGRQARREGRHRSHQGAVDGAPDRAALAADQGVDRVLCNVCGVLCLLHQISTMCWSGRMRGWRVWKTPS